MYELINDVANHLQSRDYSVVTAESCTGGGLASVLTDLPGSSRWFDRGFVTYSNESKKELLNVDNDTLQIHGAVSEAVAQQMAEGALLRSRADIAIAITGIAGPTGATTIKPVGTVCFAISTRHSTQTLICYFDGDRATIRKSAINYALNLLLSIE